MDSGNYHSRLLQKEKVGTQESCSIDLLQDSSQLIGCGIVFPTVGLTKLPVFAVLEERPPFASTQLEMFMAFTQSNSDKIL